MRYCSQFDIHFDNYNTHIKSATRRKNKDKFILTDDLKLIRPYPDDDVCIEVYISRFEPNDIIV